ncbi:MAG: exodeoxyribonuclease VII large subunit [Desulfococcaceae bacterium]
MMKENSPRIYTVSQITADIKSLLEENFPFVWIIGEISNFRVPSSGHFYFTLKDEHAQISAVMFRGQNRNMKFVPADGMRVTGLGRISLYEPRGTYQIILEYLEPKGAGELQIAFEQLKARLEAEGLFDPSRKKPIPFLPGKISVITSPSGAVIHDILTVTGRRFPDIPIEIVPVKVQGEGADAEICAGIRLLNERKDTDVIILARGGGSLEDFHAFNSEAVARAIFASEIPIISGVGHETDFTIADFVADLRAPTPSAAAEMAVPLKSELIRQCAMLDRALTEIFSAYIRNLRRMLADFDRRMIHPQRKIQDFRLRLDDYTQRIIRLTNRLLFLRKEQFAMRKDRLALQNPLNKIRQQREKIGILKKNMLQYVRIKVSQKSGHLREISAGLHSLNPTAILERGYSIALSVPDGKIIRDASAVRQDQELEVLVAKGKIHCRVEGTENGS